MTFPAWAAAHAARVVLNETLSAKTISAPSCGQNVARNLAPKCASMQLQILFRWSQAKTTEKKKPSRSGVYSYAWSMPSLTPNPVIAPGFVVFHLAPVKSNHIEVDGRCSMQTAKNDLKHMQRWLHWPQPFGKTPSGVDKEKYRELPYPKPKRSKSWRFWLQDEFVVLNVIFWQNSV